MTPRPDKSKILQSDCFCNHNNTPINLLNNFREGIEDNGILTIEAKGDFRHTREKKNIQLTLPCFQIVFS